jgi:hypothetical protein
MLEYRKKAKKTKNGFSTQVSNHVAKKWNKIFRLIIFLNTTQALKIIIKEEIAKEAYWKLNKKIIKEKQSWILYFNIYMTKYMVI